MTSASKRYSTKDRAVIVVGGGGFLGSPLLANLVEMGWQSVYCLDLEDPQVDGVEFIKSDLLNHGAWQGLSKRFKSPVLVNLTGQITRPINLCLNLNTAGVHNLIDFVEASQAKLIQISSVGVYGTVDHATVQTDANPETVYSAAKYFAEFLIKQRLQTSQFAIVRLSNLYGYNQQKGIMAYLKRSYKSDKKLFFNNDGSMIRSYLNVLDCARILAEVLTQKVDQLSDVYNFVGPNTYTLKELVSELEQIGDATFDCTYEPFSPYDNSHSVDGSRWDSLAGDDFDHSIKKYFQSFL